MAKKEKNEEKLDKDSVKKLLEFGGELSTEIKKEQSPAFPLPIRAKSNITFDEKKKLLVLGDKEAHRRFLNVAHTRKFMQSVDRKSTRLNSSHSSISYAVFCLKK